MKIMIDFEKLRGKKIAVHIPTPSQFIAFLRQSDKIGIKWINYKRPVDCTNLWNEYQNDTCLQVDNNNLISYSPIQYYQDKGYIIVEYSDICNSNLYPICYILGGGNNPLQINEKFQIGYAEDEVYHIDEEGKIVNSNGFYCEGKVCCIAVNYPELIRRLPQKKQFTDEQKNLLKALITFEFGFVVRDKCGELWAFEEKPHKLKSYWESECGLSLVLPQNLFPQITWEDEKPFDIKAYFDNKNN